jgi:hypothetical protein
MKLFLILALVLVSGCAVFEDGPSPTIQNEREVSGTDRSQVYYPEWGKGHSSRGHDRMVERNRDADLGRAPATANDE